MSAAVASLANATSTILTTTAPRTIHLSTHALLARLKRHRDSPPGAKAFHDHSEADYPPNTVWEVPTDFDKIKIVKHHTQASVNLFVFGIVENRSCNRSKQYTCHQTY